MPKLYHDEQRRCIGAAVEYRYARRMANISIKTKKSGLQYRYLQESHRVGGKVKTTTTYLGPVHPKRKPRILLGIANFFVGGLAFGGRALKGELGPPGPKRYREKTSKPDARSLQGRESIRENEWAVFRSTMSSEQWGRYIFEAKTRGLGLQGAERLAALEKHRAEFAASLAKTPAQTPARDVPAPAAPASEAPAPAPSEHAPPSEQSFSDGQEAGGQP
jgi:hypothetical protein